MLFPLLRFRGVALATVSTIWPDSNGLFSKPTSFIPLSLLLRSSSLFVAGFARMSWISLGGLQTGRSTLQFHLSLRRRVLGVVKRVMLGRDENARFECSLHQALARASVGCPLSGPGCAVRCSL